MTRSGNIKGTWSLDKNLSLSSTSGQISVAVQPESHSKYDSTELAVLDIYNVSGSVEVTLPVRAAAAALSAGKTDEAFAFIPPRLYKTSIKTTSSTIKAQVPFSTKLVACSTSGCVEVEALPVLHPGFLVYPAPETATVTGATSVRILEPAWVDMRNGEFYLPGAAEGRLCTLVAKHESTTGNINLRYPQAWEGSLSADAGTGTPQVCGRGLRVADLGSAWPLANRSVLAARGRQEEGDGITVKSTRGSIQCIMD